MFSRMTRREALVEMGAVAGVLLVKYSIDTGLLSPVIRVMLGLLSTRLLLSDLEAVIEGRVERPSLQSSHRKPLAPAPRKAR